MKILFGALATLVVGLGLCVPRASAQTVEVFGTAADGTVLHWYVYTPSTPGPWPAVLVIHGGGFNANTPNSSPDSITCAEDLAAAGYIAFSIEYRLAPPGALPGQKSDGRFPQQEDDVKLAVRTARADSRCNGQVGAVGGSAGGYHVAYVAATGTPGYDRIDVGVCLSGLYDMSDFT
ncbi:MAG: alpha/beta hydrolase, partial [Chthoniobacterales bacterium]